MFWEQEVEISKFSTATDGSNMNMMDDENPPQGRIRYCICIAAKFENPQNKIHVDDRIV